MLDELWNRRNEALINHNWLLFLELDNQLRDVEHFYNQMKLDYDDGFSDGNERGYAVGYDDGLNERG